MRGLTFYVYASHIYREKNRQWKSRFALHFVYSRQLWQMRVLHREKYDKEI